MRKCREVGVCKFYLVKKKIRNEHVFVIFLNSKLKAKTILKHSHKLLTIITIYFSIKNLLFFFLFYTIIFKKHSLSFKNYFFIKFLLFSQIISLFVYKNKEVLKN